MITIQKHDFDVAHEYQNLLQENTTGGVVIFSGLVRDFSEHHDHLTIQHYPNMTESVLEKIEAEAQQRWPLLETRIIHRVGKLSVNDQIVFVGVSSAHRKAAFSACEYMIDILKTQAPFWKKEGDEWVEAKDSDNDVADTWLKK